MTELFGSALKNSLGLQLLHWAVSQSDIWHLAHRCSELAQKINEPLEKSAYVLDNFLTMAEDDIACAGIRDLNLQQMHFDEEEEEEEYDYDSYADEQSRRWSGYQTQRNGTALETRNQPRAASNARQGKYITHTHTHIIMINGI